MFLLVNGLWTEFNLVKFYRKKKREKCFNALEFDTFFKSDQPPFLFVTPMFINTIWDTPATNNELSDHLDLPLLISLAVDMDSS